MQRQTVSVEEAAAMLGLARPTVYAAVKRGEIPAVRIGDRVLIPKAALRRMLHNAGGTGEVTPSSPGCSVVRERVSP